MQPVVANLERQCAKEVSFVRADVDQRKYNDLATQYRVRGIPHFVLLDPSGKVVRQWIGTTSQREFGRTMESICAVK
jgi:thioredoxin-related protein